LKWSQGGRTTPFQKKRDPREKEVKASVKDIRTGDHENFSSGNDRKDKKESSRDLGTLRTSFKLHFEINFVFNRVRAKEQRSKSGNDRKTAVETRREANNE